MAKTGGELLVETLIDRDVDVFGIPGDGIDGVMAVVDPHEPPMPAMVTAKQAARFAGALARGTRDAGEIVRTVVADKVRELV